MLMLGCVCAVVLTSLELTTCDVYEKVYKHRNLNMTSPTLHLQSFCTVR